MKKYLRIGIISLSIIAVLCISAWAIKNYSSENKVVKHAKQMPHVNYAKNPVKKYAKLTSKQIALAKKRADTQRKAKLIAEAKKKAYAKYAKRPVKKVAVIKHVKPVKYVKPVKIAKNETAKKKVILSTPKQSQVKNYTTPIDSMELRVYCKQYGINKTVIFGKSWKTGTKFAGIISEKDSQQVLNLQWK